MARLNTAAVKPAVTSFVVTGPQPDGTTAMGGVGYAREAKAELYLLGACLFAGEATAHESKKERMARFVDLVRPCTVDDPDWTSRFLLWLRNSLHVRTAAIIGAAEFTKARLDNNAEDSHTRRERGLARTTVDGVLQRFDEPTEIFAYWTSRYGPMPRPLKKAVADALIRMGGERALLKWDSPERAVRTGDLLSLTHPKPKADWQSAVFKHALDRRHGNAAVLPPGVPVLRYRRELMALSVEARRQWLLDAAGHGAVSVQLLAAGMTWESLAGWLQGPMDAAAWEAVIPVMGLMALTRNLRNFDDAGVSDAVARSVMDRLGDPEEVAASKQYPFRFLAAYQAVRSLRWAWPLEQALQHSLANVPALSGRTLVLVDRSASMWNYPMSQHSTMSWADAAALFGTALALRSEYADLVEFGGTSRKIEFTPAESVLTVMGRFTSDSSTDIPLAVRQHLRPGFHDRVVVVTDEQTRPGCVPHYVRSGFGWARESVDIDSVVPAEIPLYMWNFGGYEKGSVATGVGNRHCFGGLTDAGFELIGLLERGHRADWPF